MTVSPSLEASPLPVRILLVDDQPEQLISLRAVLERPDYDLVLAASGEEALAALLRDDVALVLLDVVMPGLDGFETAKLIRTRPRAWKTPIIFLSGTSYERENLLRGYAVGAVDFLPKPFEPDVVRSKVAVFAELHRQAREIERRGELLRLSKQRELELLESLYDVTFEEAPIGIGHATLDGRWIRLNRRLSEILEVPPHDVRARSLIDLVVPEERAALEAAVRRVSAGLETKHRAEYRFRRRDGTLAWIVATVSLLRDRDGNPLELVILEDVSEYKLLLESLRDSELLFSRLQESGVLAIAFERADGTVTRANDAFLQLVGYAREDLRAGAVKRRNLVPTEHDLVEGRAMEELRAHGVCRAYEAEYVRRDGGRVAVLVGAATIDVPEPGIVSFALDISDRRRIERERTRILRELAEGIQARDDFLALAAHELKTPLTPVLMQVTALRRRVREATEPLPGDWLERQLQRTERSVRQLEKQIEILLDVSRVTIGKLRLEREELDLADVTRSVVDRMRTEIEGARCELRLAAPDPVRGAWDRLRLEQVIGNLLSNALKYGAGKPVEIDCSGDETVGRVTIRDHGIGMEKEAQARIFERFERLVPVRHYGGFGLGLWIVHEIVLAHGGRIDVWSRPGEGARFTVELPRRPAAATRATNEIDGTHPPRATGAELRS